MFDVAPGRRKVNGGRALMLIEIGSGGYVRDEV